MPNKSLPSFVRLAVIAISLVLPACATYHARSSNPATVCGSSTRQSLYYWDMFEVVEVDGQSVSVPMLGGGVKVDPGHSVIVVSHHGNRGLFGRPVTGGYLPISATLEQGRHYEVTGTGTGGVARAWIRDIQTGATASKVAEQPLMDAPRESGPVYVPIVVH